MKKTLLLDKDKKIYLHSNGRMFWVQQGDFCLGRVGEWGFEVLKTPQEQRADSANKQEYINKAPIPYKEKWASIQIFKNTMSRVHGVNIPEEAFDCVPTSVWSGRD